MSKTKVLLLGASGETGGDILEGLLEDGSFDVTCLVQPSSAAKPTTQTLKDRGLEIVIGDLKGSVEALAKVVSGYNTIISAIGAPQQTDQLSLVDAAAQAKQPPARFVPCGFMTACPPGGIMFLRDAKQAVYERIWVHHLPYTIIDVGYWHQLSFPRVPSGKLDYVQLVPGTEVFGDGNVKSLLTDKRDMGHFVARIIKDPRTLNKAVITWSDELSQNDIVAMTETRSGEKVDVTHMSADDLIARRQKAREMVEKHEGEFDWMVWVQRSQNEYMVSKHIRGDNTLENAKYLGYLDARELYPDFKPITFAEFLDEMLAGKGDRPYKGRIPTIKTEI